MLPIGPWVWTRRHIYTWEGRRHDQYERYFVARGAENQISPIKRDSYVVDHRWWSLEDIEASAEDFAPRRLAQLITPLLRGEYPESPIDCGV